MKYRVSTTCTISLHTDVEADSQEEAIKKAFDERGVMSLCNQCSGGQSEEEWVTSGELDGEPSDKPENLEVMEIDDDD